MYINPREVIGKAQDAIEWKLKPELRLHIDSDTARPSGRLVVYGITKEDRFAHLQPNGARGDEYALLVDYGSEKELIEKFKTLIQEYI